MASGSGHAQILDDLYEQYLLSNIDNRREPGEALLSAPGGVEYAQARLKRIPIGDSSRRMALWFLAEIDAIRKLANNDHGWIGTVVAWLEAGDATWQESASVSAEVGFQAFLATKPDPITAEEVLRRGFDTPAGRGLLHLHLIGLRLAYRWEAIEAFLEAVGIPIPDFDPYTQNWHVFALLASDHPAAVTEMERLLAVAGDDYRVNLGMVEGLRWSHAVPEQAQLMLDLLDRAPLRTSASPDPLFRKAWALRKLGRYADALEVADTCLQRIPPHQLQDRIRILQERDLILAEQAIGEQAVAARQAVEADIQVAVAELRRMIDGQIAEVRRTTTEGLLRIVEILGLFTAIIAVLGGSIASLVAKDLSWWQRGVLIVVTGLVAMGFFITLRLVVEPRAAAHIELSRRE